ncbi:MAG: hypothetical protein RL329_3959 [Bacteroidota bacterium]
MTITDGNGCRKTTTVSIITNSIKDALSEQCTIQIFPNPLVGNKLQIKLTFKRPLENPLNLELRDALGRQISNLGPISETNFEMPLPNLSKGAYLWEHSDLVKWYIIKIINLKRTIRPNKRRKKQKKTDKNLLLSKNNLSCNQICCCDNY